MSIFVKNEELFSIVQKIFNEKIPFNKTLGMQVELLEDMRPVIRLEMRNDLVGHYLRGMLHGGVIASIIDVTGGLTAFLGVLEKSGNLQIGESMELLPNLSTIDLRVDYLRPGLGHWFIATGDVLRIGSKVAVTRIELHNDETILIAAGTGSYVIS
ncbi:MAG: thioesterase family protein [SAR324 cluster bacterium]|nr:thioesterase family protein [SAR324 cluster bacterium]